MNTKQTTGGTGWFHALVDTNDSMAAATAHLECLGYQLERCADGWMYARHPRRHNFYVRVFSGGFRLCCMVNPRRSFDTQRTAWLEFVNRSNDRTCLGRYVLGHDPRHGDIFTIRASAPGAYDRRAFGLLIDMWHEDLAHIKEAPPAEEQQGDAVENGEGSPRAATIN
jgi:hypothetical protein